LRPLGELKRFPRPSSHNIGPTSKGISNGGERTGGKVKGRGRMEGEGREREGGNSLA